jgi:predicted DNA-binding transcriptional regulator YafY
VRARRLISLLLTLQNRGHATAAELAEELGVSLRTVYRDLEALGSAGVPVTTERGPGGGCRLLGGYRTQLTGLDAGEAEALFLAGLPGPAAELGLGSLLARAQRKVLAALPARLRAAASLANQRFHLDARRWFEPAPEHPALETIAVAVWSDRVLRFAYERNDGQRVAREADAIALGLKAGLWYFVGRVGGDLRVYRVSRMSEAAVGEREFARDPAFDLRAFWDAWAKRFEEGLDSIPVTVRVAPGAEDRVARLGNPALRPPADAPATPDGDGWLRRTLVFEKLEYAESALLGFGAAVEVVEPVELRARLRARAAEIAALYGAAPAGD